MVKSPLMKGFLYMEGIYENTLMEGKTDGIS